MHEKYEMNTVQYMLQHARRSGGIPREEKLLIKKLGRSMPDMKIETVSKDKSRSIRRSFTTMYYDKYPWMCGCDVINGMFCFPCLLFSDERSVWTSRPGNTDLKHISGKAARHSLSQKHLNSELELVMLGGVDLRQQVDRSYRMTLRQRREQIDRNRFLLSIVIDCVKTCGAYDLGGGRRRVTCPGFVSRLVESTSSLDGVIGKHLDDATAMFEGTSEACHVVLLDAMLDVYRDVIAEEIAGGASFLALQADEMGSSTTLLTFRYEVKGEIVERFWGFFDTRVDEDGGDDLADVILRELETAKVMQRPEMLLSQSYDGSSSAIYVKIKEVYRDANYVHSYAHDVDEILRQSASKCDKMIATFFYRLETFYAFFSTRCDALNGAANRETALPQWRCPRDTVKAVLLYKDEIREYLEQTVDKADDKDLHIVMALLVHIADEDFTYWLSFFYNVKCYASALFDYYRACPGNDFQSKLQKNLDVFKSAMLKLRKEPEEDPSNGETLLKRPKHKRRDEVTNAVCDDILKQVEERLRFVGHIVASQLLDSEKFYAYSEVFPERVLCAASDAYPSLQRVKLRSELEVLYGRRELHRVDGVASLLQLFIFNNLTETFSETVKLCRILVTIPMPTTETERRFRTLRRAKAFRRNVAIGGGGGEGVWGGLGMLYVEGRFVGALPDFNVRVIEKFARVWKGKGNFLDV